MKMRITIPGKDDKMIDADRLKVEERVESMGGSVSPVTDAEWDEWQLNKKS